MTRVVVTLIVALAASVWGPGLWCGRHAQGWIEGRASRQLPLARAVASSLSDLDAQSFDTGSPLFDGEWALVTHQMAILGLVQVILEHPGAQDELLPVVEGAIQRMLRPSTRRFATDRWREDGLTALEGDHGHAYLGYLNLALGAHRLLVPDGRWAQLHDALTDALARRTSAAPHALLQTYPHEAYPADMASVLGSIGLHGRATGAVHPGLRRWLATFEEAYVDPQTGLLVQAADARTGSRHDAPRGSGTAIAAYFLSFADRALTERLHGALVAHQLSFLGFGAVREYPWGDGSMGDIDSGPVILGAGISSTGFSLASARICGNDVMYRSIYRTAYLFGAPRHTADQVRFVGGGPLGNAILLAMLSAGPAAAGP